MGKNIRLLLIAFISFSLFLSFNDIAQAGGKGSGRRSGGSYKSSSSGSKSIKVKGYTRKDGTYVAPHYRSAPKSKSTSYTPSKSSKSYTTSSALGVKRDSEGRIERSSKAKKEFLKSKGYDNVPEGYEVDHIIPLYKGGADEPSNMQLLPKDVHKQKTKMDLKK